ncbi:MAG: NADP-specific glutamate dehydrogenase, partial [Eggerthellaceae bacterium]|nr:NADP-specific glutamate dehydrogenase [Eggerthellaceae bacterium]
MGYVERIIDQVKARYPEQPEFIQTVIEVLSSLKPVIDAHPEYEKAGLLERMVEPERAIVFRVSWVDDNGQVQVNRGYRVQFNSAIGPYKGGLRFHPSVNLSIMKFLAFEQTFKNSLTGLPMGGGKGGSDFDPRGKSDGEIMRFCQNFMAELYRHIGPDTDVPAGDIGVGGREIGYLYGQYKKIVNSHDSVLTGKDMTSGGSILRPEATGYGAIYYIENMLKHFGDDIKGKTFCISGFGNVAWGAVLKVNQLGGKVLTISGPDGYIYLKDGITEEMGAFMLDMRASGKDTVAQFLEKYPQATFVAGKRPWEVKCDIALPCATQNEVGIDDAKNIVSNGTKYYVEVSNMPTTAEATDYLIANNVIVAPSKAVNAGGVATSGFEISQNHQHLSWDADQVD